jgi:ferrochelatase
MPRYDAFLLVSFGGPEGPDDVIPFLENVTRGRGVPRERLERVAEHYYRFGGVSPINQQKRTSPPAASTSRCTGATATGTRR